MRDLLQRLRQRKIVQWSIAYAASAWLLLEVFDLVAVQFFWPPWLRQAATVLVFFGLLVTIVLAWYHGERGRQKLGAIEFVLLASLLALGGTSVWLLRDSSRVATADRDTRPDSIREVLPPENSVAVLPCLALGIGDKEAYFADALAAELITRLSGIASLRVPSHTSSFLFKDRSVPIQEVALALKVRHVLECDISGDDSLIKIGLRLIEAESGYTLWSESYSRAHTSLFDVQQEVALAVVQKLDLRLQGRERLRVSRQWTRNPDAYEHFLHGIQHQLGPPNEENLAGARESLERAIEIDPEFGRAYARLAVHWIIIGNYSLAPPEKAYGEVERLARRAIELDGELSEAYWALGWAKLAGNYDWQGATRDFERAVELAPGAWSGHHSLGFVRGVLGELEAAIDSARVAIDLDPLAFWPRRGLEVLYTRLRNYDAAIGVLESEAEMKSWDVDTRVRFAWLLALSGRSAEAREQLAMISEDPSGPADPFWQGRIFLALGEFEKAQRLVEELAQQPGAGVSEVPASFLAALYAETGELDRAMRSLQEVRESGDMTILFLDSPHFDNLRGDPGFAAFIRELELPEEVYVETSGDRG